MNPNTRERKRIFMEMNKKWKDFRLQPITEKFIPVKNIKKGQTYLAYDAINKAQKPEPAKILSVKKDEANEYNVDVYLLNSKEKDSWYLSNDDEVFQKMNESLTEAKSVEHVERFKNAKVKNTKEAKDGSYFDIEFDNGHIFRVYNGNWYY